MSPIATYLAELRLLLHRRSRRRILAEVSAHLTDAAANAHARGEDLDSAQRHAIAGFGAPADVARQFNAVRRRPRAIIRRAVAVSLTCAATASLGSATVWALEPGSATGHPVAHRHHAADHRHHRR